MIDINLSDTSSTQHCCHFWMLCLDILKSKLAPQIWQLQPLIERENPKYWFYYYINSCKSHLMMQNSIMRIIYIIYNVFYMIITSLLEDHLLALCGRMVSSCKCKSVLWLLFNSVLIKLHLDDTALTQ